MMHAATQCTYQSAAAAERRVESSGTPGATTALGPPAGLRSRWSPPSGAGAECEARRERSGAVSAWRGANESAWTEIVRGRAEAVVPAPIRSIVDERGVGAPVCPTPPNTRGTGHLGATHLGRGADRRPGTAAVTITLVIARGQRRGLHGRTGPALTLLTPAATIAVLRRIGDTPSPITLQARWAVHDTGPGGLVTTAAGAGMGGRAGDTNVRSTDRGRGRAIETARTGARVRGLLVAVLATAALLRRRVCRVQVGQHAPGHRNTGQPADQLSTGTGRCKGSGEGIESVEIQGGTLLANDVR